MLGAALVLRPLTRDKEVRDYRDAAGELATFVELGGVELHVVDAGAGNPAVVLLHGFAASTFSWRHLVEPLTAAHRVVAFDRPGFGLSQRPTVGSRDERSEMFTVAAGARLTLELLEALDIHEAILVGHSLGGMVAIRAALHDRSRISGMVLVSPAAKMPTGSSALARLSRVEGLRTPAERVARTVMPRATRLAPLLWHDHRSVDQSVLDGYAEPFSIDGWDRSLIDVLASLDEAAPSPSELARLEGVPTLVMVGDHDRVIRRGAVRSLAEAIPGATFVELSDCGHLPQEERPEAVLDLVNSFLDGLPARS
jgi:pimeloyl-ACP methyl ester carboxylesterase